jgi:prepilin-type N-terminal cleavage/methylation domain-containing protein
MIAGDRNRGFTMVELMAALFVLTVGIIGLMQMQISSIHANAFGGRMTTATALAQDRMEKLINRDPALWPNPWPEGSTDEITDSDVLPGGYTITRMITPNTPVQDVASLNVEVQWPGGANPIQLASTRRR